MNIDKAFANFGLSAERLRGGDTGKGRVEHRSFNQLSSLSICIRQVSIFKSYSTVSLLYYRRLTSETLAYGNLGVSIRGL